MRFYGILILSFFIFPFIYAEEITWLSNLEKISIAKKLKYLEDKKGNINYKEISSPEFLSQFKQSDSDILNFGFTKSIYWLNFTFDNPTQEKLILEIAHACLPICEFYYKNDSGRVVKQIAGYNIPVKERVKAHHFQAFNLPPGKRNYYVRLLSNTHPLPVVIYKESAYDIKNYKQRLTYGIYMGIMLFVIITNLFFFFSLKNRIYLFYAIVVFIYSCYALIVLDGIILYLIPNIDLMFWYLTVPTIGVAVQTIYCVYFLEVYKYVPNHYKVVRYIIVYFFIYIFFRFTLPLEAALSINTMHALLSFFIMGYLGFVTGKKGNKMGYYFSSAYIIYFLLVLTEAIYIQTGKPGYLFGMSHVALATMIEALILFFLLSKRTEWEKSREEKEKLDVQVKLMDSLKENEKIIKHQNTLLEEEVNKRTENLNELNEELKEAIATKDKFFSIIAHDLKSPFNALIGLSEILINDYEEHSEKDKMRYIQMIKHGLVSSHDLLENLLIWSKSQGNKIKFSPSTFTINEVIKESCFILEELYTKKDIEVQKDLQKEISVYADKNMLLTIVRNLLSNAIKFTPQKGRIYINAENINHAGGIKISVSDTGVGMNEEQISKLFTLSTNVTTVGTNSEKGSGLGLLICKEFVEKHNGNIGVESTPGEGSTFYFTLPK